MKILIAEDDAVSRLILRRAVEKFGHGVLAAEDGKKAWELYVANPDIDVIISDWMMPGLDGLGLCQRVREAERDTYTYFIILTALADRGHLLAGIEAGADDYLLKPLDHAELQVRLISASRITSLSLQLAEKSQQLERLNQRLFKQSREDPLTRLGNRLKLREHLEVLSAQAERYGHRYCTLLCDVDHFKRFNDTYGHLAGDEVLKSVADVMARTVRKGDTVYRYGGEEFLAILPEQSIESAAQAAERLRRGVEELEIPHKAKEPPGIVTISAGVALSTGACKTPDEVLKEADAALYEAKEAGRNQVVARRDRA